MFSQGERFSYVTSRRPRVFCEHPGEHTVRGQVDGWRPIRKPFSRRSRRRNFEPRVARDRRPSNDSDLPSHLLTRLIRDYSPLGDRQDLAPQISHCRLNCWAAASSQESRILGIRRRSVVTQTLVIKPVRNRASGVISTPVFRFGMRSASAWPRPSSKAHTYAPGIP